MPDNVFVLGLDEHTTRLLQELPDAADYRFRPLLSFELMRQRKEIPLPDLVDQAQRRLERFDGPVDAVIGFWDFPVSTMLPILCRRLGLRWPSLESVVKCEHKYWSRLEQRRVIDEYPRFGLVDLEGEIVLPAGLRYPVWVKPVRSYLSELAFRVEDDAQLRTAAAAVRAGVERVGKPFQFVLDQLDLPPEMKGVGASACLAEEEAAGAQVTLEGYSYEGGVHIYGAVDSIPYAGTPSFLRYQYPSALPPRVLARMSDISGRVIRQVGLVDSTFNIEYFWNADLDAITLLEVNPRHSQSHAELFQKVDGVANHRCMLRLALGREPGPPYRQGCAALAAKWFLRRFSDGVVRRVPTVVEIERVQADVAGCTVEVVVRPGDRLSAMYDQDSYSYHLASVYLGAADEAEMIAKYARCVAGLPFAFEAVDPPERAGVRWEPRT